MNVDSTRIFNLNKTSFMPKTVRRKVVAVRGSSSVGGGDEAELPHDGGRRRERFLGRDSTSLWLKLFGENVTHVTTPVVLSVDNSSKHIGAEAAETCVQYGVMHVILPANATYLFQPLDVVLFTRYTYCEQVLMLERLCAINGPVVRKTNAIEMACTAFRRALID
ncbi:hypothetical protein C6341_g12725 [Phytophthora cactorum]|nr:hypothetical protein C6341_g12725 [Phytophthora cactorum]